MAQNMMDLEVRALRDADPDDPWRIAEADEQRRAGGHSGPMTAAAAREPETELEARAEWYAQEATSSADQPTTAAMWEEAVLHARSKQHRPPAAPPREVNTEEGEPRADPQGT